MLYALPTQYVINIRRSVAEKGSMFLYQRSTFSSQSSQRLFLSLWVLSAIPENQHLLVATEVCCVWHPIADQPTIGRYGIFKVFCDFCWKVVTKHKKSIISFCCWLQGFVYPINWKFCACPGIVHASFSSFVILKPFHLKIMPIKS